MKIETCVFVATSLDGLIARNDDSLDWLDTASKKVPKGEDCGFKEFLDSIDCLVMGRVTFEKVLSFGKWPYGGKKVIVLSSNKIKIPNKLKKTVSILSLSPVELVKKLSKKGINRIYLDGGKTIQNFLSDNLVDEITIIIVPVLLGSGKLLFEGIGREIKLDLIESKSFNFGFVQIKYLVKRQN